MLSQNNEYITSANLYTIKDATFPHMGVLYRNERKKVKRDKQRKRKKSSEHWQHNRIITGFRKVMTENALFYY